MMFYTLYSILFQNLKKKCIRYLEKNYILLLNLNRMDHRILLIFSFLNKEKKITLLSIND